MDPSITLSGIVPLLPEIVLAGGGMALLMLGVFRTPGSEGLIDALSIVLLVVAGVLVILLPEGRLVSFGGSFVVDDFARFLKILAIIGSAAAILMSIDYDRREQQQRFEYSVLIVLSTLGMLMLISAADLIALYLGLELMSLPLYVVAASHRTSLRSTEAGLKYFVLGALSSGMLLYGASLVYGFTGTVSFAGIAHSAASAGTGLIFGLVFLFAGFCFKVSAVPFQEATDHDQALRGRRERAQFLEM
jgi:NADH-quinone oxidoreductase subunit N